MGFEKIIFLLMSGLGVFLFVVIPVGYICKKRRGLGGRPRLWIDVVLAGVCVGLVAGSVGLSYYLDYWAGLHNQDHLISIIGCFLLPIGFLVWLGLVVRAVVVKNWAKEEHSMIRGCLAFVIIALIISSPILHVVGYKPYTAGFKKRMEMTAEIEGIREWLLTVDEAWYSYKRKDKFNLPEAIVELDPVHVATYDLENNKGFKVRLTWGGGFGHWGIEVGPEDMAIPETEIQEDGYGEYRIPLTAGAYVWHEIQ